MIIKFPVEEQPALTADDLVKTVVLESKLRIYRSRMDQNFNGDATKEAFKISRSVLRDLAQDEDYADAAAVHVRDFEIIKELKETLENGLTDGEIENFKAMLELPEI